jgi:hypothetical protein
MSIFNGFFDNFINGVTNPKGNLGDYQHAARLYTDNNMRLAPKFKHLYHVVLNINRAANIQSITNNVQLEINLLARSADLPRYRIQTETVNQYNRKKVVQTNVQYQPVNIEFHDDNAGLTTLLWEAYFRYYYNDSDYTKKSPDGSPVITADAYNRVKNGLNNVYSNEDFFKKFRYGLDKPNKKTPFFNSIQIFQLHPENYKSRYTSFTLINPIIEDFQHDSVSQENSAFSLNKLSVTYESVQYSRGYTEVGNIPTGFADIHYDKTPSPLSIEGGGTSSIFGRGGVIAGLDNSIEQFKKGNLLGGLISAANTWNNIENLNRGSLVAEGSRLLENIAVNTVDNIAFPKSQSATQITNSTKRNF